MQPAVNQLLPSSGAFSALHALEKTRGVEIVRKSMHGRSCRVKEDDHNNIIFLRAPILQIVRKIQSRVNRIEGRNPNPKSLVIGLVVTVSWL